MYKYNALVHFTKNIQKIFTPECGNIATGNNERFDGDENLLDRNNIS